LNRLTIDGDDYLKNNNNKKKKNKKKKKKKIKRRNYFSARVRPTQGHYYRPNRFHFLKLVIASQLLTLITTTQTHCIRLQPPSKSLIPGHRQLCRVTIAQAIVPHPNT
jgi:hypothetical protein